MNRLLNFISGLIMGATVGATLMILLTPVPGAEVQSKIRSRVEDLRMEVRKAAEERRREMEEQLHQLRSA